jgi:hypothetical protein
MKRPRVFIGSSSEGLGVAEAIQVNLDHDCEVELWSQGVFGLSEGTLEALVDKAFGFDFAVLVLTPDDLVLSRDEVKPSPRDNVLLELGLFIGALGRKRTFIVYDRSAPIKLPTDVAGVTPACYQPHGSGNLKSSLGAPCTLIKDAIRNYGLIDRQKLNLTVDEFSQFQVITDLLENPAQQFLILMHQENVALPREGAFAPGISYEYVIKERSSGHGQFSVNKLCDKLPDAGLLQQDLRGRVTLTARGHSYSEWLLSRGFKVDFFTSAVGGWGDRPAESSPRMGRRVMPEKAEPNAPPNGGPATPLGNSGVTDGPPSVS